MIFENEKKNIHRACARAPLLNDNYNEWFPFGVHDAIDDRAHVLVITLYAYGKRSFGIFMRLVWCAIVNHVVRLIGNFFFCFRSSLMLKCMQSIQSTTKVHQQQWWRKKSATLNKRNDTNTKRKVYCCADVECFLK